jgi:hypothetical protein
LFFISYQASLTITALRREYNRWNQGCRAPTLTERVFVVHGYDRTLVLLVDLGLLVFGVSQLAWCFAERKAIA